MSHISTISEFLLHAGTDYRVFDMGRGIRKLSSQNLLDIENGTIPAPYPRQQHIWLGVVFYNKQLSEQHYIWFIKLPLDEQGKLVSASRNHFLQIIVDALGQQLEHNAQRNGQLPENPYTFIPNQQQLADFNSISRQVLKLGQSEHYQNALAYLHQPEQHDWTLVPLQGIADIAAQATEQDIQSLLLQQFDKLASPVRNALMVSLENQALTVKLTELMLQQIKQPQAEPQQRLNALRALSQSQATGLVSQAIEYALTHANADILTIIAARLWRQLDNEKLLRQYLQCLATTQAEDLFTALFSDLVQIPAIRQQMLDSLRWTDKSVELTQAVGRLFSRQQPS